MESEFASTTLKSGTETSFHRPAAEPGTVVLTQDIFFQRRKSSNLLSLHCQKLNKHTQWLNVFMNMIRKPDKK